jgi:L,D-peptidoglycan transpeptidase YkuD (ErfK/YbiS/YcfS/YnhG family)
MRIFFLLFMVMSSSIAFGIDDPVSILAALSNIQEIAQSSQAVVILSGSMTGSNATAYLCEKNDSEWTVLPGFFAAAVGKHGFAAPGEKREGDGKSPTGVFTLTIAFGYAPECDTKMQYRQATADDYWVDDPDSPLYNTWVNGKPDAKSAEKMKRDDILYKWGIAVDYNKDPVIPGNGSAIFLHVWSGPGSITTGCAAFSEKNMLRILRLLDPGKNPVAVMGVPDEILKLTNTSQE